MGQLLRLTFEDNNHPFRILNTMPFVCKTTDIDLLLDGIPFRIMKNDQLWQYGGRPDGVSADLLGAIARAITLTFRI